MASPVSIGDALLLGKLAFKLGRAFTSGRKSAPAEFREIENQLYSLSTALSALQKSSIGEQLNAAGGTEAVLTSPLGDGQEGNSAVFKAMLNNCHATLSHLEKIVQKYAKVKDATDPEAPVFKRWGKKLATDIKKVSWTTEGGDLATLRSQLMVHINSINVILGVVNNMQIGKVEGTLITAVHLLREIQDYVADTPRNAVATTEESQVVRDPALTRSFFELYLATSNGEDLLCEHALLNFDWERRNRNSARAQGDAKPEVKLFTCGCPSSVESASPSHMERLNSFSLTPLSFAIRLVGQELSWMIYKVSDRDTGRNVSVVIKKLSPTCMLDFDDLFVQKLSVSWARRWLSQGMGTTLAFVATNTTGEQEARLLNLLGDVSANLPFVETVSISSMGRSYSRSDIDDIQITHYVAGNQEGFLAATDKKSSLFQPEDFAEIAIYYGGNRTSGAMDLDEDVVKTTLRLKLNSKVEYRNGETGVTFPNIHCTSAGADGVGSNLPNGKVTVTFLTQSAAQSFSKKVQQMRAELFIIYMRLPRSNEVVVMKLQTGGVHTEEVAMTEADIIIVQNVTDSSYRLIITSHDGRTVVSQKLASDFTGTRGAGTNFRSPTWVVNVQEDGRVRIGKCPNGFTHLVLSDVRTNRLFEKWVQSQLWQNTLPTRRVSALTGSDGT